MFDISELKEMKLPELQEIAKKAKINKYRGLKKDELIYQILDQQAANPNVIKPLFEDAAPAANDEATPSQAKQKRARIGNDSPKKTIESKTADSASGKTAPVQEEIFHETERIPEPQGIKDRDIQRPRFSKENKPAENTPVNDEPKDIAAPKEDNQKKPAKTTYKKR
jgi:transcription termination factor Rho